MSEPAEPRASAPGLLADGIWPIEWVEAALAGADLGLASSGASGGCAVTALHDPDVPSGTIRSWAIALAAARAVWAAVGFDPTAEIQRRAEEACGVPDFARGRTSHGV